VKNGVREIETKTSNWKTQRLNDLMRKAAVIIIQDRMEGVHEDELRAYKRIIRKKGAELDDIAEEYQINRQKINIWMQKDSGDMDEE